MLDDAGIELAEADLEADEVDVELGGAVVVPPLRLLSFPARPSFTVPVIFDSSTCTSLRSFAWPLGAQGASRETVATSTTHDGERHTHVGMLYASTSTLALPPIFFTPPQHGGWGLKIRGRSRISGLRGLIFVIS